MLNRLFGAGFRFVLKSFPGHHRARYGVEMLDAFQRERSALARNRGAWAMVRFTLSAYIDALHAGWHERGRERRRYPLSRDGWFAGLGLDLRHAVRSLSNSWTFTLVCLVSLGGGMAINTVIVLFMKLTFDPPRAVKAKNAIELLVMTRGKVLDDLWSYPDFEDVKRATTGMDVSGFLTGTRTLRTTDAADGGSVNVLYVSANYFQTLGVAISPGRPFAAEEDRVTPEPPIIVSYELWRDRLGNDGAILGRSLRLNRTAYRVIGVAPAGFDGHAAGHSADVWIPLWGHPYLSATSPIRSDRGADWLEVVGRLHNGTSMRQANGNLQSLMTGLAEAHPVSNHERSAVVVPYTLQGGGSTLDALLAKTMMLGLSGMVLFVVCLNIAGMVLVRTATRGRELALRMAMGSSRLRLVRHLMTESAVIAVLGGVLSMLVLFVLLRLVTAKTGQPIPVDIKRTVVVVCMGLSVATTFVIGLTPALRFSRPSLLGSLKDDVGGGRRRSGLIHKIATSVQTALALPLLVVNGMFLQGTRVMDEADYGFRLDNLLVSKIDLDVEGYADHAVEQFLRQVRERVEAVPGVTAVSVGDAVPLDYSRGRSRRLSRLGEEQYMSIQGTRISEGYFETIGTPILLGRSIERGDRAGSVPVAVVTKSLAERLWPGQNALGRRVVYGFDRSGLTEFTIVGVTADVAGASHESAPTNIYVSLWQNPTKQITLAMRATSDAAIPAIRNAIVELDPNLVRPSVMPQRAFMESAKREIYMGTAFLGGLSIITLLLAALGVYGVVAFAVSSRTREIGVRMAIGASRVSVLRMVLLDGLKLAIPGVIAGSVLAAFLAHSILQRWYKYLELATLDPVILSIGAGAALGVVLLASSMPARRAASVQPMAALRGE